MATDERDSLLYQLAELTGRYSASEHPSKYAKRITSPSFYISHLTRFTDRYSRMRSTRFAALLN
jgi:hypothetical protein